MKQLIANLNKPQITAPGWNPVPLNWSERVVDAPAGPLQPTRLRIAEMRALQRCEHWRQRFRISRKAKHQEVFMDSGIFWMRLLLALTGCIVTLGVSMTIGHSPIVGTIGIIVVVTLTVSGLWATK